MRQAEAGRGDRPARSQFADDPQLAGVQTREVGDLMARRLRQPPGTR